MPLSFILTFACRRLTCRSHQISFFFFFFDNTNHLPCLLTGLFNVSFMTSLFSSPQPSGPVFPPLYPPAVDSALVSNDMEHELRGLVTDHRRVK